MALLQDYTTLKSDESEDDLAWQLHLDRLILSAEAELRWLDRAEARLEVLPAGRVADQAARAEPEPETSEVTT